MAHLHPVYDTDPHFSIDSTTRAITYESIEKLIIVQGDHNSQRYTFEMPRYIDGHDMMLCDTVQVHYINIDSTNSRTRSIGLYQVTDMQLATDDENVIVCSWLISQNATKYVGTLNFILRFMCTSGSMVDYAWSTAVYSSVTIATSIDNADFIVEQYADILQEWYTNLVMAGTTSVNAINQSTEDSLSAIELNKEIGLTAIEQAKNDAVNTLKNQVIDGIQEEVLDKINFNVSTGAGEGSIIGNDLTTNTATAKNSSAFGTDNDSISENAAVFGATNIAGLKGYHWSAIHFAENESDVNTITLATSYIEGAPVNCEYAVNDIISIVNDDRYDECSTITAINGSVITVDKFPFTEVKTDVEHWSNHVIFCTAKPNIGLVDMGHGAFVVGEGNKGINAYTTVGGYGNEVIGKFGTAFGRENKSTYCGFVSGYNNKWLGWYSAAFGKYHVGSSDSHGSFTAGNINTLNNKYEMVLGIHNTASGERDIVLGAYNNASDTSSVAIGYGNGVTGNYSMGLGSSNHVSNVGVDDGFAGAFGSNNTVSANYSLALGRSNNVSHFATTALGMGLVTTKSYQNVFGKYNETESTLAKSAARITGWGTATNNRKNIEVLDQSGNLTINGSLRVGMDVGGYNRISAGSVTKDAADGNTISVGGLVLNGDRVENGHDATGQASLAAGIGTIASGEAQTTIGKYNKKIDDALAIIGNGTGTSARRNIVEVYKDKVVNNETKAYLGGSLSGINTSTQQNRIHISDCDKLNNGTLWVLHAWHNGNNGAENRVSNHEAYALVFVPPVNNFTGNTDHINGTDIAVGTFHNVGGPSGTSDCTIFFHYSVAADDPECYFYVADQTYAQVTLWSAQRLSTEFLYYQQGYPISGGIG